MPDTTDSPLLSEKAYRRIEEMIVMRQFPPGSMISENQLSVSLGCGRTPIREALLRLKLEGFVEIHPRRGALVLPVDITKQLELLEVRRPFEILMAELGCRRATPAQRAEMRDVAVRIDCAAEEAAVARYFSLNREIHEIRLAATHNSVLIQSMSPIFGLSRWFWYAYLGDQAALREAAGLHGQLLEAIAAGNVDEAVAATTAVLEFVATLTRNEIERLR